MTQNEDSKSRQPPSGAKRFPWVPPDWLRWLLLLPAVGAAFIFTGIVSALLSIPFGIERGSFIGGPLCAAVWVVTAYLVAPSRKVLTAVIAYLAGAVAAYGLARGGLFAGRNNLAPFALACLGGLAALLACVFPTTLLSLVASACGRLLITLSEIRQIHSKEKAAMEEKRSVRQLLKRHRWLRLVVAVAVLIVAGKAAVALGRAVVDIVPQQQRGLYMRLGRYVRTLEPGLHLKIPLIDRIIYVSVEERQGYIQHVDAMTQDNVIMRISLQYTYEVTDPKRYRLEVQEPDTIIKEFVQGKLRDIVNTITMRDLMRKRMDLGERIAGDLKGREMGYGIRFKLIQVQGAYPPTEVQEAIKQTMVTEQRTVAAKEEATQKQIIADAALYEAQKQTEAAKFKIEETAKAQKESIRMLLEELAKHESLGQKYLEYLISQELKANSKWIISGSRVPDLHLETGNESANR